MADNVVEFKRSVHPLLDDRREIVIVSSLEEGDVYAIHELAEDLRAQGHSPEQIAALCAAELVEMEYDDVAATMVPRDPDHDGCHAIHIETAEDDDEDDDDD